MNVIVQSKTLVVTEAIRSFATQQAHRLLRKGRKIGQVTVFLELIKRKKNDMSAATAKFYVDLPGKNIFVQERASDLYLAISQASKRVTRRIGKVKEKRALRYAKVHAFLDE
jgi:ribosomal subunit interface protein